MIMKYFSSFLLCIFSLVSCIGDDFSVGGDNLISVNGRNMLVESCTVELETNWETHP